ncbi:MAG: MarR family winged helix-turn-helix transcriptional regulator [Candidatus Saccharimonadales bacterium]
MPSDIDKDLDLLEEAMLNFERAMSRPRAWENTVARAGVSIDKAGGVLLHILMRPEEEGCHLQDMAERLGIEAPSVSRKVQQLEQQGLVSRAADENDRRARRLQITPAGRKVAKQLQKARLAILADVLAAWPADERSAFAALFNRLSHDIVVYHSSSAHHNYNAAKK